MLWIIGNVFRDLREYLDQHAVPYGVLIRAHQPVPANLTGVRTCPVDFSSADALRQTAMQASLAVDALLVAGYENYVMPAAVLCEQFNLPGLTVETARATTDKQLMRRNFLAYNPDISPAFSHVRSWQDIERFVSNHSFPVMLKPTNLMKSLYITKNSTLQQLHNNYNELVISLNNINHRLYTMDAPGILIEEYMAGSMHTVAGFVDGAGHITLFDEIVDCLTAQDIGIDDNFLYSRQLPSTLSAGDRRHILDVARQGVEALNLTSTMLHIELILTANGPKIIEIGARIGGYRTRMYDYSAGIDMNAQMLDLAYGRQPKYIPRVAKAIAAIELFPEIEGVFKDVSHAADIGELPSLRHFSIKAHAGQSVGLACDGYKAAAVLLLGNQDRAQLERDMAFVRQNVRVITE